MITKLLLVFISILFFLIIWPNINPVSASWCCPYGDWGDCSCDTAGCNGLQYKSGDKSDYPDCIDLYGDCVVQQSCNTTPGPDSCDCGTDRGHTKVTCDPGNYCTGVLADGCHYCQAGIGPAPTPTPPPPPPPPDCDSGISCSGSCSAPTNTCSTDNGTKGDCNYTTYSGGGKCNQTGAPDQACTTNNCLSGYSCTSGTCTNPSNFCTAAGYYLCTDQIGVPKGSCPLNGQTCTAYSTYKCTYNSQSYCDSSNCAIPCNVPRYKCSGTSCVRDDTNGTYTTSNCGGACSTSPPPSGCDPTKLTMTANPNPVNLGGSITFSESGTQGSTYIGDIFSGGVSCPGFPIAWPTQQTCSTIASGTFTWTHTWKVCSGLTNCSPQCSKQLSYSIYTPCSVSWSLNPANPGPNTNLTVTTTAISGSNWSYVWLKKDNSFDTDPGYIGPSPNSWSATINSGTAGSHTLEFGMFKNNQGGTQLACTPQQTYSVPTPTPGPPWIQTTSGDVHSNTRINTPGGP